MRKLILAATLMSFATPLATLQANPPSWAQNDHKDRASSHDNRDGQKRQPRQRHDYQRDYSRYDYNRPDPRYGNYQADRYYTQNDRYRPRRLASADRIYRGSDNRYYCRRDDGTTGLIIGGLIGGALGNTIAPGGSKTLGTLLGGGGGAVLGRSIDRGGNVTCR
jgi:hypothetical protein